MSNLLVQEYQGSKIRFETREDGRVWGCLTDMANATDKRVNNYLRLPETSKLCEAIVNNSIALERAMPQPQYFQDFQGLVIVNKGGDVSQSGTWAVEEIVIDFAYWASLDFRLWVIGVVQKLRSDGYYVMPTATSEQLEAAQKEIQQLKQKEIWLRHENQKLMDSQEALKEGELKQLIKLFVKFATKDYTSHSRYEYPFYLVESYRDRPPYSFELYWLAYWKMFKRYSQIKDYDYEYHGALDLDTVDTWRLLIEVDKDLRHYGQYNRLKQRQAPKPDYDAYQKALKSLELV